MEGYTNTWPEKVVNFHLSVFGLHGHRSQKWSHMAHYATFVFMATLRISQHICGLAITLSQRNPSIDEVIVPLQSMGAVFFIFVSTHTILRRRVLLTECMQNLTTKYFCSPREVDEAEIWRKHEPVFKCFLLNYLGFYFAWLVIVVISPLTRFAIMNSPPTYVLVPAWYPIDVITSRWFWAAYAYEAWLYTILALNLTSMSVLFLHVFMMFRVLEDVVSSSFRHITPRKNLSTSCLSDKIDNQIVQESVAKWWTITRNHLHPDSNLRRLKRGVEDIRTLRRQRKLIDVSFKFYFSATHFLTVLTNVIMGFATINELRKADEALTKRIAESTVYLFELFLSLIVMTCVCYITTSHQEGYDDIRTSMWSCSWYTENAEFQRLFLRSKMQLNGSVKWRAYSFYPINLFTYTEELSSSWSFLVFLYKVSAPK